MCTNWQKQLLVHSEGLATSNRHRILLKIYIDFCKIQQCNPLDGCNKYYWNKRDNWFVILQQKKVRTGSYGELDSVSGKFTIKI